MGSGEASVESSVVIRSWRRWEPLTGIAFVAFFVGSVAASSPPAASAPDKDWVAAYADHTQQAQHLITGILLALAALCLMSFLTILWTRIAALRRPELLSPLPLVAAGASAACIAAGGVLMAGISASMLIGGLPEPGADLLRFGNDMGFGMVALGGMSAAALSIACVSVQAHSVGLFGRGLMVFGLVVAVLLLVALAFIPIAVLLIWLIVVAIVLIRKATVPARNLGAPAPRSQS